MGRKIFGKEGKSQNTSYYFSLSSAASTLLFQILSETPMVLAATGRFYISGFDNIFWI